MDKNIKIFFMLLICTLYYYAGINHLLNFESTALDLKTKMDKLISFDISKLSLIVGIILLLAGPSLLLYGLINNSQTHINYGSITLIIFLILVEILYYPPNDSKNMNDFLKVLSLIGGLGFIMN